MPKLHIEMVLHTLDVDAGTVYSVVFVVALGFICPRTLYVVANFYAPINKNVCSKPPPPPPEVPAVP